MQTGSRVEKGEPCPDLSDELTMGDRAELHERSVMRHGACDITRLVGHHREIVVRSGMTRVDRERAYQKIAGFSRPAGRLLNEREVYERLDVARIDGQRHAELGRRLLQPSGAQMRDAEVVVRLHVPRSKHEGALEFGDRAVGVTPILIQQAEIVVNLGARLVFFEQHSILRE